MNNCDLSRLDTFRGCHPDKVYTRLQIWNIDPYKLQVNGIFSVNSLTGKVQHFNSADTEVAFHIYYIICRIRIDQDGTTWDFLHTY